MIYLDNAATTKISDKVFDAIMPYLKDGYGNASSIYSLGRESAVAIMDARKRAAKVLGGKKYNGVLWKKAADGTFTPTAVSCDMGARKYPSRFDAFPIPQSEISNNTLAKQNPGW